MNSNICKDRKDIVGQKINIEWYERLDDTSMQIFYELQLFFVED